MQLTKQNKEIPENILACVRGQNSTHARKVFGIDLWFFFREERTKVGFFSETKTDLFRMMIQDGELVSVVKFENAKIPENAFKIEIQGE